MRLRNTTTYDDRFLRDLVTFCRKELGLKASHVTEAQFVTSRKHWAGMRGTAWTAQHDWRRGSDGCFKQTCVAGRIRVRLSLKNHFPLKWDEYTSKDPLAALAYLVGHELAHVAGFVFGLTPGEKSPRRAGAIIAERYLTSLKPREETP